MIYVRKGILKLLLMVFLLVILVGLTFKILETEPFISDLKLKLLNEEPDSIVKKSIPQEPSSSHGKCGVSQPCPENHITFKMSSGAANVIAAKICLDGMFVIGGTSMTGGVGINIAVVNGQTGKLINADSFDMWGGGGNDQRVCVWRHSGQHRDKRFVDTCHTSRRPGVTLPPLLFLHCNPTLPSGCNYSVDVKPLIQLLSSIQNGSLVLMASFDDPATRLDNEARTLISQLGSSYISSIGFRDSWVFVGGKGLKNINPLEKYIKNEKSTNKYVDWPEMIDLEGCVPLEQD